MQTARNRKLTLPNLFLIVCIALGLGIAAAGARAAFAAPTTQAVIGGELNPVEGVTVTLKYEGEDRRFIAIEEWDNGTGFNRAYAHDLKTQGDAIVHRQTGGAAGTAAFGYYVDVVAAERAAMFLVPPAGSIDITTDKQTYAPQDTIIMTVTRTSGTFDRTILDFAGSVVLNMGSGQTVHTVQASTLAAGPHTASVQSGPNVTDIVSFTVEHAATPEPTPVTTPQYGLIAYADMDQDLAAAVQSLLGHPDSTTITADGMRVRMDTTTPPNGGCSSNPANPTDNEYVVLRLTEGAAYNIVQWPGNQTATRFFTEGGLYVLNASEAKGARAWSCSDYLDYPLPSGLMVDEQVPAALQQAIADGAQSYKGATIVRDHCEREPGRAVQEFNSAPANPRDGEFVVLDLGCRYNIETWSGTSPSTVEVFQSDVTVQIAVVRALPRPEPGARAYAGWRGVFLPAVSR
jgi:hypothetical protein